MYARVATEIRQKLKDKADAVEEEGKDSNTQ
jgi:hypothetical protein